MSRTEELWMNQDFEREYLSDYIFQMEREYHLELSYREWKNRVKHRKTIIKHETKYKRTSFRRTYKKVIQLRSRLSAKNGRATARLV
jgi:hypothetical protein